MVGLQTRYKDDVIFALQVKKLAGLSYIVENELINVYDEMLNTTYFIKNHDL